MTIFEQLGRWLAVLRPRGERGASLVEYALLLALIAAVCIVAVQFLGTDLNESYSSTGSSMFSG